MGSGHQKKNTMAKSKTKEESISQNKGSMFKSYSLGITFSLGAALLIACYCSTDRDTMEEIGEQIALKIVEMLPKKTQGSHTPRRNHPVRNTTHIEPEDITTQTKPTSHQAVAPEDLSKSSEFDPVGHYNAKDAMQARYEALKDVCNKYSDFMRPERTLLSIVPDYKDVLYDARSQMMFCTVDKCAKKTMQILFGTLKEGSTEYQTKMKVFKNSYPQSARKAKRAIVVRHPLERIISAYRYTYEKSFNAATGEEEGGEVSFTDFINLLLHGSVELAELLEEHDLSPGESAAVDTGLVDGVSGISKGWNPVWRQCGVCNALVQPQFILSMEHFEEDLKVFLEIIGNPPSGTRFLHNIPQRKSGLREVEEHYFSQLTKGEIRELYEKYKVDHELFGFSPDYYIAMGKDD